MPAMMMCTISLLSLYTHPTLSLSLSFPPLCLDPTAPAPQLMRFYLTHTVVIAAVPNILISDLLHFASSPVRSPRGVGVRTRCAKSDQTRSGLLLLIKSIEQQTQSKQMNRLEVVFSIDVEQFDFEDED